MPPTYEVGEVEIDDAAATRAVAGEAVPVLGERADRVEVDGLVHAGVSTLRARGRRKDGRTHHAPTRGAAHVP